MKEKNFFFPSNYLSVIDDKNIVFAYDIHSNKFSHISVWETKLSNWKRSLSIFDLYWLYAYYTIVVHSSLRMKIKFNACIKMKKFFSPYLTHYYYNPCCCCFFMKFIHVYIDNLRQTKKEMSNNDVAQGDTRENKQEWRNYFNEAARMKYLMKLLLIFDCRLFVMTIKISS